MRLCDLCAKHPEEVTGVLKVRMRETAGARGQIVNEACRGGGGIGECDGV